MLKFPKPPSREVRRLAAQRDNAARRKVCRITVLARDGYRCRRCSAYIGVRGHVHEIKFRSRGGSPYEPANCVSLCSRCHDLVGSTLGRRTHRILITAEDASGANGTLIFTEEVSDATTPKRTRTSH